MKVEQVISFLETYCNEEDFFQLCLDNFEEQIINKLHNSYEYFSYDYGETKCVLIFPNTDFVIKIPFQGREYSTWDEYTHTPVHSFESFLGAESDEEEPFDYCAREAYVYNECCQFYPEVAPLFAETRLLGYVFDTYPIYVQPLCEIYKSCRATLPRYTDEQLDNTLEYCNTDNKYCFNSHWLTDVLKHYGEHICDVFFDALEDLYIEDLHSGNVGYLNGLPVLVDYSSFWD